MEPPERLDPVVERFMKPDPPWQRERPAPDEPEEDAVDDTPAVEIGEDIEETADVDEDLEETEPPLTRVLVSAEAEDEIVRHGGLLYLWQRSFNEDLAIDEQAYESPSAVQFTSVFVGRVQILIDSTIALPGELRIERSRLLRGVAVYWDNARWGARGGAEGGGGG